LRKRGSEVVGRRVLSDHEIRLFWPTIVLRPVTRGVGLALRLAALTGARANEAAGAAKQEFQNLKEPPKAAWVIPGTRTKNKRDHLIPLSPLAVETVYAALELSGEDEEFLFPSPIATVDQSKPIDRHALATAMARFANQLKGSGEAVKTRRAEPPSPHDLRRTAETRLSELGGVSVALGRDLTFALKLGGDLAQQQPWSPLPKRFNAGDECGRHQRSWDRPR
jgi:integrase